MSSLKVRTGRANLGILDGIKVDYYGTPTPLNQVASLNVPDARLITIKPWEQTLISEIEKAIRAAQLGLNPSSDGEMVRVPMPALTEERRKELVKVVKKMAEEAKVALRAPRRDANEMLKEFLKEKQITEDEEKTGLKKVQETTDASVSRGRRDHGQERSRDPRGVSSRPVRPGALAGQRLGGFLLLGHSVGALLVERHLGHVDLVEDQAHDGAGALQQHLPLHQGVGPQALPLGGFALGLFARDSAEDEDSLSGLEHESGVDVSPSPTRVCRGETR